MMGRRRWGLPLLILLVFALLALLIGFGNLIEDPNFFVRMPVSNWVFLLGLILAGLTFAYQSYRDKTEKIRIEEQSKGAQDRRQFLRRLDHELKNPLTAMRIQLAGLPQTDPAASEMLRGQVDRISSLVTDLRKLSDLETRELELSRVNIEMLLNEAFELIQEQTPDQRRDWALTIPRAPWPVPNIQGDYDLLFLAIFNLLENAVKYSRDGDRIELRAAEDETNVTLEVADTGPGIEPEDQPHVFEELYRGRDAQTVEGSGLGLSLVNAIIRRHGGQINVRSRAGEGTVFRVSLPLFN
ncbi:MAG: HAMP domain-containing sensor histidine kinase [Chloroflexota bacterium]